MEPRQIPPIARRIDSAQIDNLEEIAKRIKARSPEEYQQLFAYAIAGQKLEKSGMPYAKGGLGLFDYTLDVLGSVGVVVHPGPITPDLHKFHVQNYIQRLRKGFNGHAGVIFFLPIQMNGRVVTKLLENGLDCGFVNLAYDNKSLERRFNAYSRK